MHVLLLTWFCGQLSTHSFLPAAAKTNTGEAKKVVVTADRSCDADTKILQFPKDRQIGTLIIRTDKLTSTPARGRVVVPSRAKVSLTVNYQTGLDMSPLKEIPPDALQAIDLHKLEITDQQLLCIRHLTGLTDIDLDETDIDDKGLDCLSEMHRLDNLGLHATCITARGLASIGTHNALQSLNLASNNIGDVSLNGLGALQNLTKLRMARSGITDRGMPTIGSLAKLEYLDLECNAGITNAGLKYLSNLKNLNHLDLSETSFTFSASKYLKNMPALHTFIYIPKNLKPSEVKALKTMLPHCEVLTNTEYRHINVNLFAPLH